MLIPTGGNVVSAEIQALESPILCTGNPGPTNTVADPVLGVDR